MRAQLLCWFDSPLGRSLQAVEAHRLRTILPSLYGTIALQLGRIGKLDLLDASVAPTRIMLDQDGPQQYKNCPVEQMLTGSRTSLVLGETDALPLDERSIDLALLPHTLDFCDDPHPVLREVSRVLRPEGHVVILGFNNMSLWGVRRLLARRPKSAPWCGHFFSLARVKDWLGLLDFECTHGSMLYYRPPLRRESARDRLYFLEKAGDRWWPMMAAVYMVVAKKRAFGMTPLPVSWKKRKALGLVGVEPAVRGALTGSYQRKTRRHG
ncbi:MAG: methyltransferase domain-containing protein [Gammaproteobacteria bacterium]|nr:methyltransferase domain-containing protein [Gammaproteobacteria bacterium]